MYSDGISEEACTAGGLALCFKVRAEAGQLEQKRDKLNGVSGYDKLTVDKIAVIVKMRRVGEG